MKKEDVYIPDQSYSSDEIHHGGKWSEEAKQRYREARRAGRSVYDMFGSLYNKANKQATSKANSIANRTIYKKSIAEAKRDYKTAINRRSAIKRNYDKINAVGSEFVNKGNSPQEKGKRAGIIAKTKSDMRNDYINSNKTVASKYNSISKASNHTLGEIAKDTTKAVGKEIGKSANKAKKATKDNVRSLKKKAGKTLNDINTNKGKGYKLTGKSKVTPKGGYERYASDDKGNVYGRRQVSVITEGTRANSITDALTGKTNAYKEHSTKTEYKMWKDKKKKKVKHSGLDKVYIPGRTGVSETILHSDFLLTNEPLLHYGIPGMKWGVRRVNKYANRALLNETVTTSKYITSDGRLESINKITEKHNKKSRKIEGKMENISSKAYRKAVYERDKANTFREVGKNRKAEKYNRKYENTKRVLKEIDDKYKTLKVVGQDTDAIRDAKLAFTAIDSSKKLPPKERKNVKLNTTAARYILGYNNQNIVGGVIKRGLNVMEKDLNSRSPNTARIKDYDGNLASYTKPTRFIYE